MPNYTKIETYLSTHDGEKLEEEATRKDTSVEKLVNSIIQNHLDGVERGDMFHKTLGVSPNKDGGYTTNKAFIKHAIKLNREIANAWEGALNNMEDDKIKTNYKVNWSKEIWETDIAEIHKSAKKIGVSTQDYISHLLDQLNELKVNFIASDEDENRKPSDTSSDSNSDTNQTQDNQ